MLYYDKENINGFTLVEALVYIAIVGLVISGFVTFGLLISINNSKLVRMQEVQANAQIAIEYISRKIRQADAVIGPAPNSASSTLELSFLGEPNMVFTATSGILYANSKAITSNEVNITNLFFTDLTPDNRQNNIIIQISAQGEGAEIMGGKYSQTLRTAITSRK